MGKNSKNKNVAPVETVVAEVVTVETKKLGRPSNPNSVRQAILAKREAAKAAGTFKKGRPVVKGSKRQEVLAARAEKIANGGTLKKGRPTVEGSKRQLVLAERAAKLAAGIEIKKGRPKFVVVETEVKAEDIKIETGAEIVKAKGKGKKSK